MTAEEIRLALQVIPQNFPRLKYEPFQVQSPRTVKYNCIGWAAGDDQNVWWPGGKYWPGGVRRDDSVAAFIAAFATRGYECCDSDGLEPGFEKVVLYVDEQHGRVTHAARQLPDGRWTSKLGPQWTSTTCSKAYAGRLQLTGVWRKFYGDRFRRRLLPHNISQKALADNLGGMIYCDSAPSSFSRNPTCSRR